MATDNTFRNDVLFYTFVSVILVFMLGFSLGENFEKDLCKSKHQANGLFQNNTVVSDHKLSTSYNGLWKEEEQFYPD